MCQLRQEGCKQKLHEMEERKKISHMYLKWWGLICAFSQQ